ncbi:toxin-activating lysine-acyltransferase [Maritalea sp.]|uniref:toxin-activating lysine-acyltransferase n=1 Tax=Maritalea sp. TaxID=2003361 RepID=UPI0039E69BC9
MRTKVHETFDKVALAMMALPRYRSLSLLDLNHVLLEPLVRDRVAIASNAKKSEDGETPSLEALSGVAIWASVSEEVDAKIREQIKAGVFPVRLGADEWNSGSINWLFDVIAPNQKLTTSVIANFKQVIKEGDLRIHPLITRLVDPDTLKKMGAAPVAKTEDA